MSEALLPLPDHSPETAPEAARAILEEARQAYGMVPNLYRKMAEAPALLEGYYRLSQVFSRCSLTAVEQQVVLIAASVLNGCSYCVAAHSTLADMGGVPSAVTDALRAGQPLPDERLQALRRFTESVVRERGWLPREEVDAFLVAGFTPAQALEVILGVGLKTLSNYTNHLAGTEIDAPFAGRAWQPAQAEA